MPRRRKDGSLIFSDYPEFKPTLTPKEMFQAGVFGGTYFRDIYSTITKKHYTKAWKEFPKSWFSGVEVDSQECDKELNKYGVKSGTSLRYWERKGWIKPQDPYGWVQWYCRFYKGRRTKDDERQIKRWAGIAGENGRFRKRRNSPVVKQLLLQWAFEPRKK